MNPSSIAGRDRGFFYHPPPKPRHAIYSVIGLPKFHTPEIMWSGPEPDNRSSSIAKNKKG
jgi:hypothetical protein